MTEPLVQITDKTGRLIDSANMIDAFDQEMIRHTAYCLLTNRDGEFLLQKRSSNVPNYPGCWDASAGGHIDQGETPEQAAYRELSEELGIDDVELEQQAEFYFESQGDGRTYKYYAHLFTGAFGEQVELKPEPSEVSEVKFFSRPEIDNLDEVTPITRHMLEKL